MKNVLFAAALVVSSQAATAGFYDGNKMSENCRKSQLFVMGYVAGAFDAAETGQVVAFQTYLAGLAASNPKLDQIYTDGAADLGTYCAPPGAVLQQVTDIYCQFLAATPAERQEPANKLLARALSKAWPCIPKKR